MPPNARVSPLVYRWCAADSRPAPLLLGPQRLRIRSLAAGPSPCRKKRMPPTPTELSARALRRKKTDATLINFHSTNHSKMHLSKIAEITLQLLGCCVPRQTPCTAGQPSSVDIHRSSSVHSAKAQRDRHRPPLPEVDTKRMGRGARGLPTNNFVSL